MTAFEGNKRQLIGAAAFCLLAFCLAAAAAAAEKKPTELLAELERELEQLKQQYEESTTGQYPRWLAAADQLIKRRPGADGLALKQMANLVAKVAQIRYATRKFGLRLAKRILSQQFLQQQEAGSLELQERQAAVLVERAKLRSLVDAYHYGDVAEWRPLYRLIKRFVRPDSASLYPELQRLATEAHAARFADQKLALNSYLAQEELLEQLAKGSAEQAALLAHVDGLLDAASECGAECRDQRDSVEDETNFFTYPMSSGEQVRAMLEPVGGLEASYRECSQLLQAAGGADSLAELADVDEEDIGLQGMEFLQLAGYTFDD